MFIQNGDPFTKYIILLYMVESSKITKRVDYLVKFLKERDLSKSNNKSKFYKLLKKIGPYPCRELSKEFFYQHMLRGEFSVKISWSVPSLSAVKKIANYIGTDKCLEIAAGHGLWTLLLKTEGVSMIATDKFEGYGTDKRITFTDVVDLDHRDAIKKYSKYNALFMSWPPFNNPLAYESLKKFKGDKFIYIGEPKGGCTGDDAFFDLLYKSFKLVECIDIPSWPAIFDTLNLYKRI